MPKKPELEDEEPFEVMEQVFRDEAGREMTLDDIERAIQLLDQLWLLHQEPKGHG